MSTQPTQQQRTGMDPLTIGMLGLQAIGSGFSASNQNKMNKRQMAQQQQQANQQLGQNYQQMGMQDVQFGQTSNMNRQQQLDQRLGQASAVQNQLNVNPLRDRAAFMLQQRAGAMPGAFKPRDYTAGRMPGSGAAQGGMAGVADAMQAAAGKYTAGAGGMDPSALRAQLAGLQDQSQMPGMYQGQTANQMRYGAESQQMMLDAAKAKYAKDRVNLQNQANTLAGTLGGGAKAPTLATGADYAQADKDAQKAAAKKRMMMMAGLGAGAIAAPFMPAAFGALGGLMKGKAALGAIPTFASGFTDS